IRVPEGRYLVSAGITQAERMGTPISRDVYYPQTFHPNVSDPSQARAVEVSEGAETTGVDILIAEARKTFDIKGRVVRAETGEPAEGIEIFYGLHREGGGVVGPRSRGARSNSEGEFLFQGLLPGKYAIYPQIGGEGEYFSEPVICEITDGAIDGVEVKLQQGSSISGTIVIEGANDPAVMAKLSQVSIGGFSKSRQSVILPREGSRINADGGFRIAGVRPGRIYFALGGDPKAGGFAIKRIERDGALAQDGIEIGPGENLSNVRVIVGHGNLTLRGEVKVIGGSLPPHIGIYVNLNRVNESESGSTLGAFVDGRGQFMFQNLILLHERRRVVHFNVTDHSTVAWTARANDRGVSGRLCSRLPAPRPGFDLRTRFSAAGSWNADRRGDHRPTFALAKSILRTPDRQYSPRVSRPRDCTFRRASSKNSKEV